MASNPHVRQGMHQYAVLMHTRGAPGCPHIREPLPSNNRCSCRGEAESRRQIKQARNNKTSWALFTGHTWIKPQGRAVAATSLGDYEHLSQETHTGVSVAAIMVA